MSDRLLAHPGAATASEDQPLDLEQVCRAIELALRLGEPQAARQAAIAVRERWPEAISPLALLGQALLDLGRHQEAAAHFHRALKLNPLSAAAWAGLAAALARCGRLQESQAALRRAALHDPLGDTAPGLGDSPQPLGLGVLYLRRGLADLAVAELAAALAREPRRADLRLYYVEALRRCDNLGAARSQLALLVDLERASLPATLLQLALGAWPGDGAVARARCAGYDPDGQQARLLAAPEPPPWEPAPPPALAWAAALDSIRPFLTLLPLRLGPARKSAAGAKANLPPAPPQPDPDVSSLIATTERVRLRVASVTGAPGPLANPAAACPQAQVLLGCRFALIERYGEAAFAAIDRRLRALAAALGRRGLQTHCCYLDDAASLRVGGGVSLAPVPRDAAAIGELVRAMSAALAQERRELAVLLLIGGDECIPFHRLPNPAHDDDGGVLSDSPYASDDAGYLAPQRIVARLPDGAGPSPALLLATLDQMIDYHHGRMPRPVAQIPAGPALLGVRWPPHAQAALSGGYTARVWQESSRAVLDAIERDAALHASPPLDADALDPRALAARRLLYVNLHGGAGLPNWYGQGEGIGSGAASRLPVALRPDQIGGVVAGGILVSEACYGMELPGRTTATSIPLRALAEGALACVGATASAYGSYAAPLVCADLLCQRLLAHLARGLPVGHALQQARLEFAQTIYHRQGFLDDVDVKTLGEFVLLGDPWAGVAPLAAASGWAAPKLAGAEGAPAHRPLVTLEEARVPGALVGRARAVLKRVLPGAAAAPLRIAAQPEQRLARKGHAAQDLVFSASEARATSDGHQVAQTAHITLRGEVVVKVALTR